MAASQSSTVATPLPCQVDSLYTASQACPIKVEVFVVAQVVAIDAALSSFNKPFGHVEPPPFLPNVPALDFFSKFFESMPPPDVIRQRLGLPFLTNTPIPLCAFLSSNPTVELSSLQ